MPDTNDSSAAPSVKDWPRFQRSISIVANTVDGVLTPDATIEINSIPFTYADDGSLVFSGITQTRRTTSAYALSGRLPSLLAAISMIKQVDKEWEAAQAEDLAALTAEQTAAAQRLAAAQTAAAASIADVQQEADDNNAAAATALTEAASARQQAYADMMAIVDRASPERQAAATVFAAASATWDAAKEYVSTVANAARNAIAAAEAEAAKAVAAAEANNAARIKVAQDRVNDAANPPIA